LSFVVIVGYLIVERIRHQRRLKRIRIRIHVNGTRGKSSVTRLIASALRHSGIRTLAKTTGSAPQLILPDGNTETIRRRGPANILEQLSVIRRADQLQVDAIVVECMALDPVLQFVSETKLLQSTIGVITNVRPDHFEVMGDTLDDIASSLAQTIPLQATLITADSGYFQFFADQAAALQTPTYLAGAEKPSSLAASLDRLVFTENLAIAEQVCRALGLDPAVVTSGLASECSVPEDAIVSTRRLGGKSIHFINAFSANDIESTRMIEEWACFRARCPKPWVALFNNRDDRPMRMNSFAGFVGGASAYDYVAVMGENLGLATRRFRRFLRGGTLLRLDGIPSEQALSELLDRLPHSELTVIGMGNERGTGELVHRFATSG